MARREPSDRPRPRIGRWTAGLALLLLLTTPPSAQQSDQPAQQRDVRPGNRSTAEQERQRAQDLGQRPQPGGAATDDQSYLPRTQSQGDLTGQINNLGRSVRTQEKPVPAHAPEGKPVALTPPEKPQGNTHTPVPEIACQYRPVDGWFQPVQGVYQDDPVFTGVEYDFTHRRYENPQIEKQNDTGYFAALPMIVGRHTVLMGVTRYKKKGSEGWEEAGSHDALEIIMETNCTRKKDVKFRFRLEDGAGRRVLYTSPEVKSALLLGPPAPKFQRVSIKLEAKDGVPPTSFTMTGSSYFLTAELVDLRDNPVGLAIHVGGPLVTTNPLNVQFVPVIMNNGTMSQDIFSGFKHAVADLADASENEIPDYFPLTVGGLPDWVRDPVNLSSFDMDDGNSAPFIETEPGDKATHDRIRRNYTSAGIASRLGAAGMLGNAQRVVAVFRGKTSLGDDYDRVSTNTVGYTLSTKVVAVKFRPGPKDAAGNQPDFERTSIPNGPNGGIPAKLTADIVDTVAHELVHTMPDMLWSGPADDNHNMNKSCDLDYHGISSGVAWGERVTINSNPQHRRRADSKMDVMGSSTEGEVWISQCTYGHLIPALMGRPDPDVLLVRGMLSRAYGKQKAKFDAFYDMGGVEDGRRGPIKDWGLRVRDKAGKELAAFPIDPHWYTEEHDDRLVVPLFLRIPAVKGAASIEMDYKAAVLEKKEIASAPPSLTVMSPVDGAKVAGKTLHVAWRAASAAGGKVLSSVFYSPSKGKWFNDHIFESAANADDVPLDPHVKDHVIKIVVTDGGRSSQKILTVHTQ